MHPAHLLGLSSASWDKPRRVIAKIEWHPGEYFPRVGVIVINLPVEPDWVVLFYNQRGIAKQHVKGGKYTFRWTQLSCKPFRYPRRPIPTVSATADAARGKKRLFSKQIQAILETDVRSLGECRMKKSR